MMLAGVYINEFWGSLLILTTAMTLPVLTIMLAFTRLAISNRKEARYARVNGTPGRTDDRTWATPPKQDSGYRSGQYEPEIYEPHEIREKRWKAKREAIRQAVWAVVKPWREKNRLATFGLPDLPRAPTLNRYILMLTCEEQAVIVLRHGLIDRRRQNQYEIARRTKIPVAAIPHVETRALLKIDAFHGHANSPRLRDLEWLSAKAEWISYKATHGQRTALIRTRIDDFGRSSHAGSRSRQWIENQLQAVEDLRKQQAQRAYIPAAGLVETWQTVRGLKAQPFSPSRLAKTGAIERCLALLDLPESPVARGAWLSQLTRYNPINNSKYVTASGAVKPCPGREPQLRDVQSVENVSEIRWLLGHLPARERLVLELNYGITTPGEFSEAEIARLMDLKLADVTKLKQTALAKLNEITRMRLHTANT
jgi:hypothetical protein